jgi:hypothetical protein
MAVVKYLQDFVRYYEEQPEEKRTKIICKKCGEEGHATAECTVLIVRSSRLLASQNSHT